MGLKDYSKLVWSVQLLKLWFLMIKSRYLKKIRIRMTLFMKVHRCCHSAWLEIKNSFLLLIFWFIHDEMKDQQCYKSEMFKWRHLKKHLIGLRNNKLRNINM